jgi:hypothetical protein
MTRKPRLSGAFDRSGRPDSNRGPPVPQTVSAGWRGVAAEGAKWLESRRKAPRVADLPHGSVTTFSSVWARIGHRACPARRAQNSVNSVGSRFTPPSVLQRNLTWPDGIPRLERELGDRLAGRVSSADLLAHVF